MLAGTTRRSQAFPEEAQPRATAKAVQNASAATGTGQSAPGAAVRVLPQSSQSADLSGRVEARQGTLGAPASKAEAGRQHLAVPGRAATDPAGEAIPNGSGAVDSKKVDASGLDPMQRNAADSLKPTNHLRQKHELAADQAAQAGQAKESLIQAVPEMPERRASLGWPDAQKGLNIVPPPRQTNAVPYSSQEEVYSHAGGSTNDDASEADLEALLGQLVNRAELI